MWIWLKQTIRQRSFIICLFSFIVAILGAISFFGYLTDFATLNRWGAMTNMAWHTAMGFMVWGIASVIHVVWQSYRQQIESDYFQALATFFCGILVFVILWEVLLFQEARSIRQVMRNVSQEIIQEYKNKMNSESKALKRLAQRWIVQRGSNHVFWKEDVENYLAHHDAFALIGRINKEGDLAESYSHLDDQKLEKIWFTHKTVRSALKNESIQGDKNSDQVILIDPIKIEKKYYIAALLPLREGTYFDGYMVVLYDLDWLSDSVLSQVIFMNYNVDLSFKGNVLFSNNQNDSPSLKQNWSVTENLKSYGNGWEITVWPSWQLLQSYRSHVPLVVLIVGIIFSFVLTILVKIRRDLAKSEGLLRQSNDDLESFSYSISHDLRAPLRHMTGFIDLLNKKSQSHLDRDSQRYLTLISSSAMEMGNLIDGILLLSRIGRRDLKKQVVSVEKCVWSVIDELKPEYENRDIQWEVKPCPKVYVDPDLFKLVIQNILSNAIKFTRHEKMQQCK